AQLIYAFYCWTRPATLLRRNVVGADHLAPQLDLAAQQRGRRLGAFLGGGELVHAALGEGLLHLGVGERGAQRGVELVDDRARRAGRRQQHVPEIDIELGVAEFAERRQVRQAGKALAADDGEGLELAGIDQRSGDHGRYRAQVDLARQQV